MQCTKAGPAMGRGQESLSIVTEFSEQWESIQVYWGNGMILTIPHNLLILFPFTNRQIQLLKKYIQK